MTVVASAEKDSEDGGARTVPGVAGDATDVHVAPGSNRMLRTLQLVNAMPAIRIVGDGLDVSASVATNENARAVHETEKNQMETIGGREREKCRMLLTNSKNSVACHRHGDK